MLLSERSRQATLGSGENVSEWLLLLDIGDEFRYGGEKGQKKGITIFLTGLPSAGKSTIAQSVHARLLELQDRPIVMLDGDVVRQNISKDLGFSKEDRDSNVGRIGLLASEITQYGAIAVCAVVSPYADARNKNRSIIEKSGIYIEVYVATPLEVCEQRDPKGLYRRARQGLIHDFTGVDDPYEVSKNAEIVLDTVGSTSEENAEEIIDYLRGYNIL